MFEKQIADGAFLRLLEERHAPVIFDVVERDRAYLREWLPWVDSTTEVEHTRAFIRSTLEQFAANEGLTVGLWYRNEFAGTVGTHKINWPNRKVEIGYWLAAKFQGRGLITAACRALIDHAFDAWELNRVELHCAVGNARSCRVAERLGFRLEGVIREAGIVNGKYLDANLYGLLARDWRTTGPR